MDPVLTTPRLKLTLLTHAERGSKELEWLHELRSNKQSQAWSIHGPSTTLTDTEKIITSYIPSAPCTSSSTPSSQPPSSCSPPSYKIAYAIHNSSHFVGLITITSLTPGRYLPLPAHLVIPTDEETNTLVVELAYSFLPSAWGKGYATEALGAVLGDVRGTGTGTGTGTSMGADAEEEGNGGVGAAKAAFWKPWERVWMRVIVNERNPASLRVMRKMAGCGVREMGVFEWKGERIFLGGEWRTEDNLVIFGGWLKG
ncbi:hypothetical protein E8E13_010586 [Curvularia kusanoi]|uniref:N-acetyltransferase domain-containing protein n=1 Tax=Curvularia kusanoi TaxID=90978 RepID=A0A9P4TIN5_CURKU|nr:hypothetical protein E8E13_010586 [Curvularia kusanoi]